MMSESKQIGSIVYVVDDDDDARRAVQWVLESVGLRVVTFTSGDAFLDAFSPEFAGCVVLDVRMPGISGLETQQRLREAGSTLPIIFVSGHSDVRMTVRAMKGGAFDFLEKPVNEQELLELVQNAIQINRRQRRGPALTDVNKLLPRLTPRELEVMDRLVSGKTLKQIAGEFGFSGQTAAKHRARILNKMEVDNDVELTRLVLRAETHAGDPGTVPSK